MASYILPARTKCGFANAWAAFYCGWYLRKTWAK